MADQQGTGRVWPPIWREHHRVEKGEDFAILDCVMELLADCKDCPNPSGRHKTHLPQVDLDKLRETYGNHWAVGFYIDAEWNVEVGICKNCMDKHKALEGRRN